MQEGGPAERTLLFVYGTLRRGEASHDLLAEAVFVAEGHVRGRLAHLGPHPVLLPDEDGTVPGEVWRVDAALLARVDAYEGPGYRRRTLAVRSGGRVLDAWAYVGA